MNKKTHRDLTAKDLTLIDVARVPVQKLISSDGLVKAKNLHIGKDVIIVLNSKRIANITTKNGQQIKKWIFTTVDENGNPLGWIYAEFLFPEMIII